MFDSQRIPRPLRWYEWLAILLIAGYAAHAHAGPVYRCVDSRGTVTFRDNTCADTAEQSVVALAPAPKYAASPEYAIDRDTPMRVTNRARHPGAASRHETASGGSSYECRTADGQVFYRHNSCPHSVAALDQSGTAHRGRGGAAKSATAKSIAVTSTRVSRDDACYEMRRAGAGGRSGHNYDQDVSTYDKNLGRDLCH